VKKAITLKHKNFKTSSPHRLVKPGVMKKPSAKPVQAKKKAVVHKVKVTKKKAAVVKSTPKAVVGTKK
jgi:hypothetical protein